MAIPNTRTFTWPKGSRSAWSWREWLGNLTIFQALGSAAFAFVVATACAASVVAIGFAHPDTANTINMWGAIGIVLTLGAAVATALRRIYPNSVLVLQCVIAVAFASMPFLAWASLPAALRTASRVPHPRIHHIALIGTTACATAVCFYVEQQRSVELRALSTVSQDGSVSYMTWLGYGLIAVTGVTLAAVRAASSQTALLERIAQTIRSRTGRKPLTLAYFGVFAPPSTTHTPVDGVGPSSSAMSSRGAVSSPSPVDSLGVVGSSGSVDSLEAVGSSGPELSLRPVDTAGPDISLRPVPLEVPRNTYMSGAPILPQPQGTAPRWSHFGPPKSSDRIVNAPKLSLDEPPKPRAPKTELQEADSTQAYASERVVPLASWPLEAVDANSARELERERIAMELHDTVAHQLSLAALQASALEVASETMDVPQSAQAVRGSINKALDEMRALIWALRDSEAGGYTGVPPTLEDLERLISDASASGAPIRSEIRIEQGETAHLTLTNAMYRITQEALTNAIRYGVKSSIFIRILGAPGLGVTIDVMNEIADNSEIDAHGSLNGLGGMQARAEALGGSVDTSTLGNVWLFQAKLPWQ